GRRSAAAGTVAAGGTDATGGMAVTGAGAGSVALTRVVIGRVPPDLISAVVGQSPPSRTNGQSNPLRQDTEFAAGVSFTAAGAVTAGGGGATAGMAATGAAADCVALTGVAIGRVPPDLISAAV